MPPSFQPGFVTPSAAEALQRTVNESASAIARLNEQTESGTEEFPAKITSGSSGVHAWTEQTYDSAGARIDRPGGRTGTTTFSPAVMPDASTLTSFPQYVRLRRARVNGSTGVVYEIIGGGSASGGGLTLIDSYNGITTATGISYTFTPSPAIGPGEFLIAGSAYLGLTTNGPLSLVQPSIIITPTGTGVTAYPSADEVELTAAPYQPGFFGVPYNRWIPISRVLIVGTELTQLVVSASITWSPGVNGFGNYNSRLNVALFEVN